MATRGGIARSTGNGTFQGRYHHWDSYPDALGKTLWDIYHNVFNKDIEKMLKVLLDDHTGWSTINNSDWTLEPGYGGPRTEGKHRPQCYCHGERNEEGFILDEKKAAGCGCEWVYVFGKHEGKDYMMILCSYNKDGSKMVGMFGFGNARAYWNSVAEIDLNGEEPDWSKLP